VQEVHIFGDNDISGRAATLRASEVHMALGRRVVLRFPPDGLKDFNDLLNADADETLRDLRPDSVKGAAAA
jgi:DNA primase